MNLFTYCSLIVMILGVFILSIFTDESLYSTSLLYNNDGLSQSISSIFSDTVPIDAISDQQSFTDSIPIPSQNHPPTATDMSIEAQSGRPVSISLGAFDPDVTDTLEYFINSNPSSGELTNFQGNMITYTPNQDFSGADTFSFSVTDGHSYSNVATISISVQKDAAGYSFPTESTNIMDNLPPVPQQDSGITDNQAPSVTSTVPPSGATNVAANTLVSVTLSEPMDTNTLTDSTFSLKSSDDTAVPATVTSSSDGMTATLQPSGVLTTGMTYTASITGITDIAGNALPPTSWSFTVAPSITNTNNIDFYCDRLNVDLFENEKETINCIIRNNNDVDMDLRIICNGLLEEGLQCDISNDFDSLKRVNANTEISFSIGISVAPNTPVEPGLYPFTLGYRTE